MYQQGDVSPLFLGWGRGSRGVFRPKTDKFQSHKCDFQGSGSYVEDKRACFFIRANEAFIQLSIYQSQSIPTSNEQMMKTKLSTLHVNKFCVNL